MRAADQLSPTPIAFAQIEQAEAREISRRDGQSPGPVTHAESQKSRIVLAFERAGEPAMQHSLVNRLVHRAVNFQEERVLEKRHLIIVVIERRARRFADAVTRSLRRKLPKSDRSVFEVERRIERRQPRLELECGRVEARQQSLFDGFEKKVRVPRFGGGSHIAPLGRVAPLVDQIAAPRNATASARELCHSLQRGKRKPQPFRLAPRPRFARKDRRRRLSRNW